jgi:hypothetical protein
MANASETLFVQFTKVRNIHCGFNKWNAMDDDQKKFISQLAIDTQYFQPAFANPCTM